MARPPAEVWAACASTASFRRWWPSLVEFEDVGGRGLVGGAVWRAKVRGPLLYTVAFRLDLGDVEQGSAVAAAVSGDIHGAARLTLTGDAVTELALAWELRSDRRLLRLLDRVVPWATAWAHDRVVDACLARFVAAVEEGDGQPA